MHGYGFLGYRKCAVCSEEVLRVRRGTTIAYCPRCDMLIDMVLTRRDPDEFDPPPVEDSSDAP